ncbi:FKBP-type peptidyl-prolyl cis-trans isomerase [Skermania piniformis]
MLVAAPLLLVGCGSDEQSAGSTSTSHSAAAASSSAAATAACPAGAGTPDPQWQFPGDTGSIAVTGPTDDARPVVEVTAPFHVETTTVHTLSVGSGSVVAPSAIATVCYEGVNGRTGKVFDSSYDRGLPAQFQLGGVVAGFAKAISGQTVGSDVAVAITSADGYPSGQPQAGIEAGDTLVFVLRILSSP